MEAQAQGLAAGSLAGGSGARGLEGGRFSSRLTIVFGTVVLLVVLLGLLVAGLRFRTLSQEREESLLRSLALPLSTSVRRVSFSGKYHAQLLLEEFVAEDPNVRFIVIQTYEKEVYAQAGDVPQRLLDDCPKKVEGRKDEVRTLPWSEDMRVLEVPFRSGYMDEEIGVLRMGVSRQEHVTSFQRELGLLLGLGLLAGALSVLLVSRVSRSLATPVEELADDFQGILAHSPLAVCIQDGQGRPRRMSANLGLLLGWTGSTRPSTTYELYPEELREGLRQEDAALISGGQPLRSERQVEIEGRTRTLVINKFLLHSEEGPRVCSLILDVTEQRELEQCLVQARRMDTIGQFAGGVAHDFNNLLTGIMATAELARLDAENYDDHCERIVDICRRAAELTQRLLTFGRRQVMVRKREDLSELCAELSTFLRRIVHQGVALDCEPLEGTPLPVKVDRGQFEQALMNLVGNAQDALGDTGRIAIRTGLVRLDGAQTIEGVELEPGPYAYVEVSDDGPGIDPELRKRLFDPFATSKAPGKGTGLGLSIVFSVFTRHGGAVSCESELGKGTTFRGYVPLDEAKVEKIEVPSTPRSPTGLRLLLADDNDAWRETARVALERLGHSVVEAKDGEEAWSRFSSDAESFDLAVLDVIMPGRNGGEVFLHIRELRPDLPVLFVTGYDNQVLQQVVDSGHERVSVLTKPLTFYQLSEGIESLAAKAVGS